MFCLDVAKCVFQILMTVHLKGIEQIDEQLEYWESLLPQQRQHLHEHTNFQFVDPWNYKHPLQMPKRDDATSSSSSAAAAEAEISHSGNENGEDEDENQTEKNNASTIVSTGKSQGIFARMHS